MKELAILLADKDAEAALKGLLKRSAALGICPLPENTYDVFVHPLHDHACYFRAHEYMRRCLSTHHRLLVIFDYHGCGAEHQFSSIEAEKNVEKELSRCGWENRCCAIAIDPELEIWVWSDSPHVEIELGWRGKQTSIREWLVQKSLLEPHEAKPKDPKKAMKAILKEAHKPLSSAIFGDLAKNVGFSSCVDRAFLKFKETLQRWFPNQ